MRRSTPRHHIVERCVPRGHAALTESNKSLIFIVLGTVVFKSFANRSQGVSIQNLLTDIFCPLIDAG